MSDRKIHLDEHDTGSASSSLAEHVVVQNVTGLSAGGDFIINGNTTVSFCMKGVKNPEPEEKLMFQVKDPVNTFTGRKEFLEKLHASIQECRKKDTKISILSQTSSITGLGGIGKSETVRMYIKQFNKDYDSIVWIDAEYPSETMEQFNTLADQKLNICLKDRNNKSRKFSHIVADVYEKLCQNSKHLLIIFDNAEALDPTDPLNNGIHQFLPPQTTTIEPPIILVTSRQKNWKGVNLITLDLWDKEEGLEHIYKRLKLQDTPENRKNADQLAALFDNLPIAIEFAVSVILEQSEEQRNYGYQDNKRYGIQNLISDYSKVKTNILDNEQPVAIQTTIQKLLDVSVDKIRKYTHGQVAIQILALIAYLSPTKIPKIILQWLLQNTTEQTLNSAIALLTRYSIIHSFEKYITIHRVLQDVIIRNLPILKIPRNKFIPSFLMCSNEITILRQIISKLTENKLELHPTEDDYIDVITNLIHTTEYIIQQSMTSKFYFYIEDLAAFVKQQHVSSKLYMALIDCDINITKLHSSNIFLKIDKVGSIFYSNGRYKKSFEIYNTLLYGGIIKTDKLSNSSIILSRGQEKELGALHPDTLTTKHNIAQCLSDLGKEEEALCMYYSLLEEQEIVLGTLHPSTLITKHSIAQCLTSQQKHEEALGLYYVVLETEEKVLGALHPDALITKHNIAQCLHAQRKYEEALTLYYVLLNERENVLGSVHPGTLAVKHNIARCLSSQGKHQQALRLYNVVLKEQKKVLGELHPDTFTTKHSIAQCLGIQGNHKEALKIYREVLDAENKILGTHHPETLITKHNVAHCLSEQGQFKEALTLYYVVHKEQENLLGALHPSTLTTKHNIANCISKQGKKDEALKLYYTVLEEQYNVLGALHPSTLTTKHNIAQCLVCQGNYKQALKLNYEVLEDRAKAFGTGDTRTLPTKPNICEPQHDEALRLHCVVLEAQDKERDAAHTETFYMKL